MPGTKRGTFAHRRGIGRPDRFRRQGSRRFPRLSEAPAKQERRQTHEPMGIFYTEFTLPQNIGAFTVIKRPVSFCLVFHPVRRTLSAAFNLFRRKSPPNAFDNFLHRKPKHRPASFPPPHSTFVTAKVCRMDLKMRENIPTPVHEIAPSFSATPSGSIRSKLPPGCTAYRLLPDPGESEAAKRNKQGTPNRKSIAIQGKIQK